MRTKTKSRAERKHRPSSVPCPIEPRRQENDETGIIADHPLAAVIGSMADEPLWDEFMQAIRDYTQEVEERDNTAA